MIERYLELRILVDRFICEFVEDVFEAEGLSSNPFSYRGTRFHKPYEMKVILPGVKEVLPNHLAKNLRKNEN